MSKINDEVYCILAILCVQEQTVVYLAPLLTLEFVLFRTFSASKVSSHVVRLLDFFACQFAFAFKILLENAQTLVETHDMILLPKTLKPRQAGLAARFFRHGYKCDKNYSIYTRRFLVCRGDL